MNENIDFQYILYTSNNENLSIAGLFCMGYKNSFDF